MPLPSKVSQLPDKTKAELDRKLIESAFSGYRQLEEWLDVATCNSNHSGLQSSRF
jgi:hypothetical protein